ncbi:hypothetical protein LWI28_022009 [Acer negundo]|uniref:Xylanase inhibitor C-terminal domain-containing protein n=1 Tax=Acer negundo TaxID=4023 RepID=A0AAD5J8P4_ACENE|nr:hypothetical protein LWI28_022009 [Acer negundo]
MKEAKSSIHRFIRSSLSLSLSLVSFTIKQAKSGLSSFIKPVLVINSPLCKLPRDDRRCHADKCGYKIKYGDGSSTEGDILCLGVVGVRLPLSEDIFQLTKLGDRGVILDIGTAVTILPTLAYEALRDAFTAKTKNLPRAPGVSIFDTCYHLLPHLQDFPSLEMLNNREFRFLSMKQMDLLDSVPTFVKNICFGFA